MENGNMRDLKDILKEVNVRIAAAAAKSGRTAADVEIVAVTDDTLVVKGLDAVDGTPVLDIKPYYPVYDRRDATVPEWVNRLMEYYF